MLNCRPELSMINFEVNNIKFEVAFVDNKMAKCYHDLNK